MPSASHRVDRYAEAVLDGGILAGPYVRAACERHRRDRARAASESGWYQFSEYRADYLLDFFESCLRLPDAVDDDGEPSSFSLSVGTGFWAFILGSLGGWIDGQRLRRFREAYIEAGKGSAKTPVLAGLGLFGLMMDGERAAEIYAAAADQDQAGIMFRDAVRIAKASQDITPELEFDGGAHIWQIRHPSSLSFFRTFSREGGQKSGPRPHMGLLDELHEHPNAQTSTKIRAGAKRRQQPLFVEITNSGYDRTSICWQRHEHSVKVVQRALEDDRMFAYVCALDEGDDPLTTPAVWPKTNPYIGVSVTEDYLRRQVENAKNIPAETNDVLRLNFCVWTLQHTKAISIQQWLACKPVPSDDELRTAEYSCGCMDVGETDDLSAFGRLYVMRDGRVAVRMRFWLPESALEKYPNRPYAEWRRTGLLEVTKGPVTDYTFVRQAVMEECRQHGIKTVFYDRHTARETAQILEHDGLEMVEIPPGFAQNEAIKKFLALVSSGDFCHDDNKILTWMASNLVLIFGGRGDRRIAKERAGEKIDGIAAVVMGIEGAIVRRPRDAEKQYQMVILGR